MTEAELRQEDEAIAWVIRTRDPDFLDWAGFTAWLEADAAHAALYDHLSADDADLPALIPATPLLPEPANDRGANDGGSHRWRWIGGAVAAALVAFVSVNALRSTADPYSVTTGPGETRDIALADGTRIALNGDTSLRLDHNNPRFAALDRGEAVFTVTHDASDPFRVTVGDAVFEDAGTIFDIARTGPMTRIGVAEGKVIYNPRGEAIALSAGRALRAVDGQAAVQLSAVAPQAVAGWRNGRLTYDAAPLSEISADLSRTLGVPVASLPGTGDMRFTGTLRIDRDPARFFASAAPLMGVQAVRGKDGWLLKAGDGPAD